jgi:hypothetical protein
MYQLAPPAPPCFPSRLDWIEWLASAAAAQVKGREPGPLLLRQGAAPKEGAFAAFDLTVDFCADCEPAWRKQARVVERGVCKPDWLRQFAPEPVTPEPEACAEEELCLSIAPPGETPPSPASSGASPCSSAAESPAKRPKLWPIASTCATASATTAAAASSAPDSSTPATLGAPTAASPRAKAGCSSRPCGATSSPCGASCSAAAASTTSSPDPIMNALERHPLSALLPDLTEEETAGLRASIRANGVIDPVTIYEGMVLDGWNRYKNATLEQVACPTVDLPEGIDPVEFVRSRTRGRNMTPSALALLEVKLTTWRASGERTARGEPGSPLPTGASVAEMAARAGVSDRTIQQAKAVAQAAEPVQQAVKAGKLSVKRGAEIARLPEAEQAAALERPAVKAAAPQDLERVKADAAAAAGDDYMPTPTEIAEEQEAIIRTLQEQLASAQADDAKAENLRLRIALQNAERTVRETMDRAAQHQSEARKSGLIVGELCRLLDLNDTRKLVAAVKALVAKAQA